MFLKRIFFQFAIPLRKKPSILYFRYLFVFSRCCYFPEFRFLELFVMLLHFRLYKYFSFRLTRKPYPNFCQILTMDCIIDSPLFHILKSE